MTSIRTQKNGHCAPINDENSFDTQQITPTRMQSKTQQVVTPSFRRPVLSGQSHSSVHRKRVHVPHPNRNQKKQLDQITATSAATQSWINWCQNYLHIVNLADTKSGILARLVTLKERLSSKHTLRDRIRAEKDSEDLDDAKAHILEDLSQSVAENVLSKMPSTAFGRKSISSRVKRFVYAKLADDLLNLFKTNTPSKSYLTTKKPKSKRLSSIKCAFVPSTKNSIRLQIVIRALLGEGGCKTVDTITHLAGPIFDQIGTQTRAYAKPRLKGEDYLHTFSEECELMELLKVDHDHFLPDDIDASVPPLPADSHVLIGEVLPHTKNPLILKAIITPLCEKGDYTETRPVFQTPRHTTTQLREALVDMIDAAKGLQEVHERYHVHLDVKSENFLRKTDLAGNIHGYLADLGLSAAIAVDGEISMIGTQHIIAPEQLAYTAARKKFMPQTSMDMWSYGLVLLERFYGRSANAIFNSLDATTFAAMKENPRKHLKTIHDARKRLFADLRKRMTTDPAQTQIARLIIKLLSFPPKSRPDAKTVVAKLTEIMEKLT